VWRDLVRDGIWERRRGVHASSATARILIEVASRHDPAIVATNAPNLSNESVADLAWGLLIAASRRMAESDQFVRSGAWRGFAYNLMLGMDLHRTTLGIVGMGRIGQAMARRAAGFDMSVMYYNRTRLAPELEEKCRARHVPLDTLLGEADHVVLALPYSAEAHHLIGAP
jgi:lactate dehydrogenase-like 2-hydroxyacid dehydrogenase